MESVAGCDAIVRCGCSDRQLWRALMLSEHVERGGGPSARFRGNLDRWFRHALLGFRSRIPPYCVEIRVMFLWLQSRLPGSQATMGTHRSSTVDTRCRWSLRARAALWCGS